MRINPTRPSQGARSAKGNKSGSATTFTPLTEQGETATAGVMPTSTLASVDALIALQAETSIETVVDKATKRASSLLGILDTIRIGLLEGDVSQHTLQRLLSALDEQREDTQDPTLEAILEQVELRAQVELAKLETGY